MLQNLARNATNVALHDLSLSLLLSLLLSLSLARSFAKVYMRGPVGTERGFGIQGFGFKE